MRISLLFLFVTLVLTAWSSTLEVCSDCEYTSIATAVESAVEGDTVYIRSGIYREHDVEVLKGIHIIGETGAVIDAQHKGTVLSIRANNFSVQNLILRNVGLSYIKEFAAIHVSRSDSFKILNNSMEHVFFGCLVEKSHYGEVAHNKVSSEAEVEASSGNGTHMWHCSNMKVHHNEYSGLRDGIYFEFVTESEVYNNVSNDNLRYGLHFMFSNDDDYHDNLFMNNGAGVAVMFSKNIKMKNNTFMENWGTASYGLLLKEINDAEIANNIFKENTIGINIEGSNRISYHNNVFEHNGWALKVVGACYDNSFTANNFLYNSFDLSYNTKINSNVFEGNYWSEYTGYDRDRDGIGDVPHRPVKLFSYIVNQTPETIVLLRSLFVFIINFSEKVSPIFTPDNLVDPKPLMHEVS